MLFIDDFQPQRQRAVKPLLAVRAKLCDSSQITAKVADAPLIFKTAIGSRKIILLREIKRMRNIGNVVTLRRYLWANKFAIDLFNGDTIVGVPKSPGALQLCNNDTPDVQGDLKLWEIDWLEVEPTLVSPENRARAFLA